MITIHANAGGGWSWERDDSNRPVPGGWFAVTGTDEQVADYIKRTGDRLCFDANDVDNEDRAVDAPLTRAALHVEPEECEHGLSAWLCADPISHYPRDL